MIEAKMAAEAAQLAAELEPEVIVPSSPKYSIAGYVDEEEAAAMLRRGSRSTSVHASRPRAFSRLLRHHRDSNLDPTLLYGDGGDDDAALRHLGSPQQLTRSVSCKRPGSFKKMRSKNASPNTANRVAAANANYSPGSPGGGGGDRDSKKSNSPRSGSGVGVSGVGGGSGQRRGTQCSITLMDDFNPSRQQQQQNRAGSLPFENLIRPQTLTIPSEQIAAESPSGGAEVYRVRQFVTSKGAVINRGDSFKRSFKRSNQSLSSGNGGSCGGSGSTTKKGETPTNSAIQHMNMSEQATSGGDGTLLLTTSNHNMDNASNGNFALKIMTDNANGTTPMSAEPRIGRLETPPPPPDKIYVVYVLGATTVGKNALIKQFKTSEYRGTYDICPHQSTGMLLPFLYPQLHYK